MPARVVDFGGHLCHNVSWLLMETAMGEGFWCGVLTGVAAAMFAAAACFALLGETAVGVALCFGSAACGLAILLIETR